MRDIVIVDAVRTPVGKYKGSLRDVRADHLSAILLRELLTRNGIEASSIDDVVFGCVTQVGEQSANIARTALLGAGFPESIPGITVDRKCGSSETAVHVAVGEIAAGACDVVIAGGAENMTRVKMGGNREIYGEAFGWKLAERFEMVSQGEAAERVADKWNISRGEMDEFSLESHRRAAQAQDEGRFDREIVPVKIAQWKEKAGEVLPDLAKDETIRRETSLEKLSSLKPSFRPDGRVTAGNSSQISDGASVVLLMSADAAKRLGLKPRARIRAIATVGVDPTLMLTGPVAATRRVLDRSGLSLSDIDLFEVNEAFASVPLMWMRETGVPHEKLNVNGGAVALGHPLGASGARIMSTLLNELERRGARYGLQTICCAGGLGTATIIERL
ncbi:MAG: thiolase family protein [Georgfuchsia sp.]